MLQPILGPRLDTVKTLCHLGVSLPDLAEQSPRPCIFVGKQIKPDKEAENSLKEGEEETCYAQEDENPSSDQYKDTLNAGVHYSSGLKLTTYPARS